MNASLSQEKAIALLRAVEGVLAEFGAIGPGAVVETGDVEAPASYLLDHLYDHWNECLNEIHSISVNSSGSWEPDPLDAETMEQLRIDAGGAA